MIKATISSSNSDFDSYCAPTLVVDPARVGTMQVEALDMTKLVISVVCLLLTACPALAADPANSGANLGNVRGGDFSKARSIIDRHCTSCHKSSLIDTALSAGKDMGVIQREMESRGAKLSAKEREVLGIFWNQNPLKK